MSCRFFSNRWQQTAKSCPDGQWSLENCTLTLMVQREYIWMEKMTLFFFVCLMTHIIFFLLHDIVNQKSLKKSQSSLPSTAATTPLWQTAECAHCRCGAATWTQCGRGNLALADGPPSLHTEWCSYSRPIGQLPALWSPTKLKCTNYRAKDKMCALSNNCAYWLVTYRNKMWIIKLQFFSSLTAL